ncbi:MAG: hypothetical protein ACP5G4_03115 [bacterium]
MNVKISHNREDESPLAKARWFQSLSLAERMDMLCWFTDLMLEVNPKLKGAKDVKPVKGRIQIISKA